MARHYEAITTWLRGHEADVMARASAQLDSERVGYSVVLRFYPGVFEPQRALLVTKEPDGYSWVPYDPLFYGRKGRTAPKARRL